MKRLVAVFLPLLVLGACSGIDKDVALDDQLDDDDRGDFVDGVVEGAGGIIVRSEAQCWSDAVIDSGATPADLELFAADPMAPAAAQYTELLTECIDPDVDIDVPVDGDVRTAFIEGLAAGGLTDAQANCFLDGLVADGFDGRDLFMAGVSSEAQAELSATLDKIAVDCL